MPKRLRVVKEKDAPPARPPARQALMPPSEGGQRLLVLTEPEWMTLLYSLIQWQEVCDAFVTTPGDDDVLGYDPTLLLVLPGPLMPLFRDDHLQALQSLNFVNKLQQKLLQTWLFGGRVAPRVEMEAPVADKDPA